jgi:hypothetical protein
MVGMQSRVRCDSIRKTVQMKSKLDWCVVPASKIGHGCYAREAFTPLGTYTCCEEYNEDYWYVWANLQTLRGRTYDICYLNYSKIADSDVPLIQIAEASCEEHYNRIK